MYAVQCCLRSTEPTNELRNRGTVLISGVVKPSGCKVSQNIQLWTLIEGKIAIGDSNQILQQKVTQSKQ